MRRFAEIDDEIADAPDVFFGEFAIFLAEIFAQRREPRAGVNQLRLALFFGRFAVRQHPDIGRNAGIVKQMFRQRDNRLQPVVFDDIAANVAFALPGVAGEERRAVMHFGDAAAKRRVALHFGELVDEKEQLPVAGARNQAEFRVAAMRDEKAQVFHLLFAA